MSSYEEQNSHHLDPGDITEAELLIAAIAAHLEDLDVLKRRASGAAGRIIDRRLQVVLPRYDSPFNQLSQLQAMARQSGDPLQNNQRWPAAQNASIFGSFLDRFI